MSLYQKAFLQGVAKVFSLPRLSIPLILTLGLTLGAVLSVISISSTLLYKPLQGVKNEASLQTFEYRFKPSENLSVSYWNMRRLASVSEYFADLGQWAGISPSDQDITINNTLYATTRYDASSNILEVLGTELLLGDDVTVASPQKYIWISQSLWQKAYSGKKSVLGKQITIDQESFVIAGVIEDVMAVNSAQEIIPQQVWFINNLKEVIKAPANVGNIDNSLDFLILKSEKSPPNLAQTNEWLTDFVTNNAQGERVQRFLDFLNSADKEVINSNYRSNMLGESESLLTALFAAVFGLLLMATINLLNLFIAHYQTRTKEFAIQISLGASLLKVKTLVLLENLPSFLLAAITGLLVTGWALKSLPLIAGESLPMIGAIGINIMTIIATLIIVFLLSILFSALALVDIETHSLANNLNSSGKGLQAQSNQWLSRLLMVFQLSIASLLLTASVMLTMQSYQSVYQDLGYELGNTYDVTLSFADEKWREELADFEAQDYQNSEIKTLLTNVSNLIETNVADSKVVIPSSAPLSDRFRISAFRSQEKKGERVMYQIQNLSPDYFKRFNIRFLAGTNLTQSQINNNENRIVIDESMAKTIYPDLTYQEVIGKTIQLNQGPDRPPMIISGIVVNTISRAGAVGAYGLPAVYTHRVDAGRDGLQFSVMLPEGKDLTADMLDPELKRQFPGLTNLQVRPLNDVWQIQTLNQRVSLWVVVTMTVLTLFLAAIGVAGLTQMTTNHKKYELAVRMATGAKQTRLLNFILKDALWMLIIGLGIGFIISVFGYKQLQIYLEMLPEFNWLAMSALDLGLITIVLLSVIIPAWRVISSEPMRALREE
ncbi:ABC transporter permease [Pseudoalteromonas denitrificans]|uniref:Duplicated orphan permease n=1 Tax=Pseudoalteromonas denitrificans DSM 6059 TaxID=1123010 RepID=A0A1I1N6R6_9GAMM|nr:ABC transporter permease [Pseudoalteromonas denitrificans]SFC90503.1 duplicated orphan permease [Pseudoalteromonas denitrificans DSM 6059]